MKTLRHYHELGLLEPAEIDPKTGYRHYSPAQIPVAHIIRRFRALDMPLGEIQAVLAATDLDSRNQLITSHLKRLESELARTQGAVASLRNLLEQPKMQAEIGRRRIERTAAASIREVVEVKDALVWLAGAVGELHATLSAQRCSRTGPPGALYSNPIFSQGRGEATLFIPCEGPIRAVGRVSPCVVPAVELATLVHKGSHQNVDLAYGALATYVSNHAIGLEEPLREYYLVGPQDTADESAWRTEIGWPIFL